MQILPITSSKGIICKQYKVPYPQNFSHSKSFDCFDFDITASILSQTDIQLQFMWVFITTGARL